MDKPKRRTIRLKEYDYNTPGYYFITFYTKEKQKLLCDIVGTGLLDGPQVQLTVYGEVANRQLQYMKEFYEDIRLKNM